MKKTFSKTSIKSITLSLLFLLSSIGASVLINPVGAAPNSAAATPLTALQANWAYTDGNQFAQDYNPQTQINNTNAQNLGLSWLFPLPGFPTALLSVSSTRIGVDTTPLIINGTIYTITQEGQIIAINAANGNQLWTTVLPILPNSTLGKGVASLNLHFHQGEVAFSTANFGWNSGGTATYWISAPNLVIYAINALNGKYEMNFTYWHGPGDIAGNSPTSIYAGLTTNIVIDSARGIIITSMTSTSNSIAGRCFYRGWNIKVSPPALLWTSYCSPPQPNSNVPLNPNWSMQSVNNMTGAQIFYPGPAFNSGGTIPSTGVVDLKTLSPSVLNATLYNDWGQSNQSPFCLANDGGQSTGGLGQGWGGSWVVDQKTGIAYINTGNRAPYTGACNPGPDLWQASTMAINDQTGAWVWGFMTSAHDSWDYDCSWYQGLANETISGVNTLVFLKTCKNGYVYEINAATGKMIFAWTPPSNILPRCQYCYMFNPLNSTQMTSAWPAPNGANYLANPSELAGFESTAAYSPATNMIYIGSHNVPAIFQYIPLNASNYGKTSGIATPGGQPNPNYPDNATIEAVNAATGQMVWSHNIPTIGFRGGLMTSGNVVFAPLVSGDVLMLNALTGAVIKDLFIGAPMDVVPSIGATASGTEEIILTVGSASFFGPSTAGDIVALQLQNLGPANTITTTATTTATTTTTVGAQTVTTTATTTVGGQTITTTVGAGQTVTTTIGGQTVTTTVGAGQTATITTTIGGATVTSTASGGGVSSTTLYAVAAVAVIFIIATGYLAMRGRKPAS